MGGGSSSSNEEHEETAGELDFLQLLSSVNPRYFIFNFFNLYIIIN